MHLAESKATASQSVSQSVERRRKKRPPMPMHRHNNNNRSPSQELKPISYIPIYPKSNLNPNLNLNFSTPRSSKQACCGIPPQYGNHPPTHTRNPPLPIHMYMPPGRLSNPPKPHTDMWVNQIIIPPKDTCGGTCLLHNTSHTRELT